MVCEDDLVDAVFAKEGVTYGDRTTRPPIDQPTGAGGITLATLASYVHVTGAPLVVSVDTLKGLTRQTADPIVRWKLDQLATVTSIGVIAFAPLRWQLLDFAYNSGAERAIRWFQRVLRVPRSGRLDRATFAALTPADPWLVHQALIGARVQMIFGATRPGGGIDHGFEDGLEARAFSFSLLDVP